METIIKTSKVERVRKPKILYNTRRTEEEEEEEEDGMAMYFDESRKARPRPMSLDPATARIEWNLVEPTRLLELLDATPIGASFLKIEKDSQFVFCASCCPRICVFPRPGALRSKEFEFVCGTHTSLLESTLFSCELWFSIPLDTLQCHR